MEKSEIVDINNNFKYFFQMKIKQLYVLVKTKFIKTALFSS